MGLKILLSPAGSGKTEWAVSRIRAAAVGMGETPRLVLPSRVQVADCQSRLARMGGALGAVVCTLEELAWQILGTAGHHPARINEFGQRYLLKDLLQGLDLEYYGGIKALPGFNRKLLGLFREFETSGIEPAALLQAAGASPAGRRLSELAEIYQVYQDRLAELELATPSGAVGLAAGFLRKHPDAGGPWDTLIFDGFDDLSPAQLELVSGLSARAGSCCFTLTGGEASPRAGLVHKRFAKLEEDLCRLPDSAIEFLPDPGTRQGIAPALAFLRPALFDPGAVRSAPEGDQISLAAVPDREAEVRKALRWIKDLCRRQGTSPDQAAVLVRSLAPYRPFLESVAREYGLAVRIQGGLPLVENPLIDAILGLLRIALQGREGLRWREVVSLWRSAYFNWEILYTAGGYEFSPEAHSLNCQRLREIAHWGRVVGTYQQWEEVFSELKASAPPRVDADDDAFLESAVISPAEASQLWDLFQSFLDLVTPLEGSRTCWEHAAWLEELLGISAADLPDGISGLGVPYQVQQGGEYFQERDWIALQKLTELLRGRVWAAALLDEGPLSFQDFLADLVSGIETAAYQPLDPEAPAITCADITEARGISLQAVALLGLGEGEFPATIQEDPFLRDQERAWLRDQAGLDLQLSTASAEAEYFYEAVCRAGAFLLVTRPRIADNGAAWQPSPYWEELTRCLELVPEMETTRTRLPASQAGSLAEYFEILASSAGCSGPAWLAAAGQHPIYASAVLRSSQVLGCRIGEHEPQSSPYNGGLGEFRERFQRRYPGSHVWSCSRLESYQTCPFFFFTSSVLGFDQPEPPREGLDARQLGNLYHQILERLYSSLPGDYTLELVLESLPAAAQEVFEEAPAREGFRETAWWDYTQEEILANLQRSLIVLENLDPRFRFYKAEQRFGISAAPEPSLEVETEAGAAYLLRGFIDRVDRSPDGGLRIIDYKTSGSSGFTNRAVAEGKKLQLPLYALAAQQALKLGRVEEGFYFHLRSAQASSFKLASYREGPRQGTDAALARAAQQGWEAVRSIQAGDFQPAAPTGGCPVYCPAAAYCWAYQPSQW